MLSQILSTKLKNLGIHYGWVIAALAFMTTMFSSATISVPQLLILPLTEYFGWKISEVTVSIAIMYVVLASIAPFVQLCRSSLRQLIRDCSLPHRSFQHF